jgi:mannose-1-phosphate guanylyltransferase
MYYFVRKPEKKANFAGGISKKLMNRRVYCVIMAGGVGSRFWPESREERPKQFLDILGVGKTFLRQTYERFLPMVPPENFLVVTGEAWRDLVAEQIPELAPSQILGEPLGRNTAPCLAYAAFRLRATDPDAVMIATPADHLITGEDEFGRAISESVGFAAANDAMMTIGIQPTRPDTGYGYIQIEERYEGICKVRTFTEKPNAELAKVFVDSGEFFWNSGIFVWRGDVILAALKEHLGDLYELFESAAGDFGGAGEAEAVSRLYPETRNVSIDFGVLEQASNVHVRISDFGWSDVGTWNSLYDIIPHDEHGNAVAGQVRLGGVSGSLVRLPVSKLAVLEGLEDYIVVDTPDVLLVWPRSREHEIKHVVTALRFDGGEDYL